MPARPRPVGRRTVMSPYAFAAPVDDAAAVRRRKGDAVKPAAAAPLKRAMRCSTFERAEAAIRSTEAAIRRARASAAPPAKAPAPIRKAAVPSQKKRPARGAVRPRARVVTPPPRTLENDLDAYRETLLQLASRTNAELREALRDPALRGALNLLRGHAPLHAAPAPPRPPAAAPEFEAFQSFSQFLGGGGAAAADVLADERFQDAVDDGPADDGNANDLMDLDWRKTLEEDSSDDGIGCLLAKSNNLHQSRQLLGSTMVKSAKRREGGIKSLDIEFHEFLKDGQNEGDDDVEKIVADLEYLSKSGKSHRSSL